MTALPILLVTAPEAATPNALGRALTDAGCEVQLLPRDAVPRALPEQSPGSVVLLDTGAQVGTGLSCCRELRRARRECRLCVLLPPQPGRALAAALEMGADVALAWPVEMDHLVAQLRALGRTWLDPGRRLAFDSLEIDPASRRASRDGHPVQLTDAEFDLLLLLARHAGLVLTRDLISRRLRGLPHDDRDRSIDLRVVRIRQKLGDDPHAPRFIKSVRGEGYLFLPSGR